MRRRGTRLSTAAIALLPIVALAHAKAGTITAVSVFSTPGTSTGTIGPVGSTPAPNNDAAAGPSPNVIPITIFFNTQGLAEIEFAVDNSGGATEYLFTQTLVNNTGQTWAAFRFELGFGTGAAFVRSGPSDSLDFDTPERTPVPTSSVFTLLDHLDDTLGWTGGAVPSVSAVAFSFTVDVPDGLSSFHPGGLNRFTLRQVPIAAVPEPGGLTLLAGMGATCLLALRRRKQGR